RRFQAGESLLDLAHVVLDAAEIRADRPQVLENEIFNIISHIGSPVELSWGVYHKLVEPVRASARHPRWGESYGNGG
ncbi:hypothetical protein RZS08_16915, partial [Arthrospira platensis SPKY1]|nr:hypothetical protein [Arthrospira platensis SPKY1]